MAIEIRDGKTDEVFVDAADLAELIAKARDWKKYKHTGQAFKILHYINDAVNDGKMTKFEIGGKLLGMGFNVKFD